MINTVYRLCAPRRFEIAFSDLDVTQGVIVRPTHLSICNADQRYYQGTRDIKVLKEKNIIRKGCFNEDRFDHTSWYTFTDYGLRMMEEGWS